MTKYRFILACGLAVSLTLVSAQTAVTGAGASTRPGAPGASVLRADHKQPAVAGAAIRNPGAPRVNLAQSTLGETSLSSNAVPPIPPRPGIEPLEVHERLVRGLP
mgnify:CR=1 FL=1